MKIKEAIDFFVWLKENRSWLLEVGIDEKLYADIESNGYRSWSTKTNRPMWRICNHI